MLLKCLRSDCNNGMYYTVYFRYLNLNTFYDPHFTINNKEAFHQDFLTFLSNRIRNTRKILSKRFLGITCIVIYIFSVYIYLDSGQTQYFYSYTIVCYPPRKWNKTLSKPWFIILSHNIQHFEIHLLITVILVLNYWDKKVLVCAKGVE